MDRISDLPQDLIEKILTLIPIRGALRTSILSKKWRYCWTTMPRLEFPVLISRCKRKDFNRLKLVKDIFHVLLLHKGPILEFSMYIDDEEIANQIDPIILHLSMNNSIKKFNFENHLMRYNYVLPSSFFSLQRLEHIVLVGCVIQPPLNFNGFSMLRSMSLHDCAVTCKMLQRFVTNCPLLEEFTLEGCDGSSDVEENNTFFEVFKFLSSVQILEIYNQDFSEDGMPQKLPTPLVHLKIFDLDVCLEHEDLSFVFCVINSSPNLEKLIIRMYTSHGKCVQQEVNKFLDFQDYSDINLDKLEQLEIRNFRNLAPAIGFMKLILAKSPVLKKAQMQLSRDVSVEEEFKMLQDLVRLPFPRASPTANVIIKCLKQSKI